VWEIIAVLLPRLVDKICIQSALHDHWKDLNLLV